MGIPDEEKPIDPRAVLAALEIDDAVINLAIDEHRLLTEEELSHFDHGTPLHSWAAFLLAVLPSEYAEPPVDPDPTIVLRRVDIVEIYRERVERGYQVFHADDLHQDRRIQEIMGVSVVAERLANGADDPIEELVLDSEFLDRQHR